MAVDNKYGSPTIEGIPADEPVFILRAQDVAAIDTIDNYIDNAEFAGATKEFIAEVEKSRDAFADWAESHDTKVPD